MPNRLAKAQSLYLRKHADNPVDWWPWCDAALDKARRDGKPIFLSIGYSSCHWCTVMEGEAFSDAAIADYLNQHFLPIKVDREERPDIDSIYMQALQMMVGQGGWPLNIFLSPDDLVPFYGGTYFPVETKYGRPGFLQVLQALRQYFDTDQEKLASVKAEILQNLQQSATLPASQDLSQAIFERGVGLCTRVLQPTDRGTRFPMMPYALAALRGGRFNIVGETQLDTRQVCQQRGLDLVLGGIFDQVGGGFHRYTVDPTWTVPHFEKMLYDNGQILEYLAELWSIGLHEPAFERAIALTKTWLKREMTSPAGYFYAAQDADSFATPDDIEPEEGAFYVWTYPELRQALSEDALHALTEDFTVTMAGNFEGYTVLQRRAPGVLSTVTETALEQLFQRRYGEARETLATFPPARDNQEAKTQSWPGRIPAVTDTKMIVAWNSLMISGLARVAAVWGDRTTYDMATQAATFILQHQWVTGRLHRLNYEGRPYVLAQSEDYALLIKALLDLHQAAWQWPEADPQVDWLQKALAVQTEFDHWLWSEELAGYYNIASDASDRLLVRERTYQDSAVPAANGIAIANLVKLSLLTSDLTYLDRAEKSLQAFGAVMAQIPRACPSLFTALDWFRHATLVRTPADKITQLVSQYTPTAVFLADADLPANAVGLVCEGLYCKAPATDWEMLRSQLETSQQRPN
ncbi:MAG: thioredoxin domain-containing protein [Leptolyngbya sp. SIOISBB]|nr:thioredoxin domain-containing protein [Leptolyngbya sp. SIOISBB]